MEQAIGNIASTTTKTEWVSSSKLNFVSSKYGQYCRVVDNISSLIGLDAISFLIHF